MWSKFHSSNRHQEFGNGPLVVPIVVFVIPIADGTDKNVISTADAHARA
jgi:hypothetical protein